MSRCATFVLALIIVHALARCKARPAAKPVSFYMTHPAEREQLMAACKAAEEARKSDADCINAGKAWLASWAVRLTRPTAARAPEAAVVPARAAASSEAPVTLTWNPLTGRPFTTN